MSFLENVNSAIEEAEQHLFCRRLVVHNKIMANFLHNLVEKVDPFMVNQTFEKLPKRIKLKVTMVYKNPLALEVTFIFN